MKIFEWIRLHLFSTVTATSILSAAGGFVVSDFANWRSTNRDFMKSQTEASQKADQDLIEILRKFSNTALGKEVASAEDLKALQSSVTKSYVVAAALSGRLPALKSDFDQYADALFRLQKSAEKLTGATDGQSFVEAVSAFADRRQAFQKRLASLQTAWPL